MSNSLTDLTEILPDSNINDEEVKKMLHWKNTWKKETVACPALPSAPYPPHITVIQSLYINYY